jgi:hypothetical protein
VLFRSEGSKEVDIGTLKYVAKAFGVDMDTVVKWFTLAIVLVFDPLAVALVLAYNSLIEKKFKPVEYIKDENSENSTLMNPKKKGMRKALDRIISYRA